MNALKKLIRMYTAQGQPGFLGQGHTARPVIQAEFENSDPFILLMDDILDKKDYSPAGGPHPHAGFETVTLVLEGHFGEGENQMKAGDFEMMTAGSGIVHTETITEPTKLRILQLWLNLPKERRWTEPRVQKMKTESVPTTFIRGGKVRVYSGSFAGLTSPVKNYTPFILAHIYLNAGASLREVIPGDHTSFIYVIKGSVNVGEDMKLVNQDQVGWFERTKQSKEDINLYASEGGAEVILYAAQPQKHPIVSHGPFIADTMDEIKQLYADYRRGTIRHINDVDERQLLKYEN